MKIIYEWLRQGLRRIEFFGPDDIAKKKEIPHKGRFAKIHEKYLSKLKGNKK